MPISLRLSPEGEKKLDEMVKEGHYKDRSEAIRAALSVLKRTMEARRQGRIVVSVDPKDLRRLGVAVVINDA